MREKVANDSEKNMTKYYYGTLNEHTHMDRMGATASSEAMRMPISQIPAVSNRAHVGSPFAFPWPNT